ncbi:MAG TPA: hypothetical protein PLV92_24005 [Pirellulaceae bacterium]|nr:hypothetical protein [Pirellulaceae bacterium]
MHELPHQGAGMPLTAAPDLGGRPFLYVAAKEGGLLVFNLQGAPRVVRHVPLGDFGGQHVMSVTQSGRNLYAVLGDHWGKRDRAGLAVVDVDNPVQARVVGTWRDSTDGGAGGDVAVRDGTAYLAAMGAGLVVLDVSRPAAIHELARMTPDVAFPDARPDRAKINARGVALRGDTLFLCYDAGGVRAIYVSNGRRPREVGRYSNPALAGKPRAYNHLVVDGARAFVTADYLGLEILDVANPRDMKLVGWWNPWNPQLQPLRWFSSPGHTNEIAYSARNHAVLMSAGRTDVVAVDVRDPTQPKLRGQFGDVDDTRATWGLALRDDVVYATYIRTLGIPFRADWAGLRILKYRP